MPEPIERFDDQTCPVCPRADLMTEAVGGTGSYSWYRCGECNQLVWFLTGPKGPEFQGALPPKEMFEHSFVAWLQRDEVETVAKDDFPGFGDWVLDRCEAEIRGSAKA